MGILGWVASMFGGSPDAAEVRALREELASIKAAGPASLFPNNAAGVSGLMGGGDMVRDGERYAANKNWVFACTRAIASRIAGQPIRVGRKQRRARGTQGTKAFDPSFARAPAWVQQKAATGGVEMLDDHAILDLMDDPNPLMVAWSLIYVVAVSLELTGRAFLWLKENDEGKLEMWPIPSSWVTPLHSGGKLFDAYRVNPPSAGGEGFVIQGEDMLRFSFPDAADPTASCSTLSRMASAVRADEAICGAQESAFRNGVRPGVVLTVGPSQSITGVPAASGGGTNRVALSASQRAQILHFVKSHYRGYSKFNEPLLLDDIISDIKRFDLTPAEMGFIESAGLTKSRILETFGVSELILGAAQNSNRAAALSANDIFNENTCNPRMVLLSQVFSSWFQYRFKDRDLLVWLEPAVAIDPDAERIKLFGVYDRGGLSINELRSRLLNLGPIAGGHVAMIAPQLVPYEVIPPGAEPPAGYNPFTDGPSVGDNGDPNDPEAGKAVKLRLSDPDPEPAGGRGGVDPALNGRH